MYLVRLTISRAKPIWRKRLRQAVKAAGTEPDWSGPLSPDFSGQWYQAEWRVKSLRKMRLIRNRVLPFAAAVTTGPLENFFSQMGLS